MSSVLGHIEDTIEREKGHDALEMFAKGASCVLFCHLCMHELMLSLAECVQCLCVGPLSMFHVLLRFQMPH